MKLFFILSLEIVCVNAFPPVFTPAVYRIQVGLNTTKNTILTTLTVTDPDGDNITYATASPAGSTGGASYFGIDTSSGSVDLVLVNRLDVEYGSIQWDVEVLASDGTGNTATATVNVTTYQSTTTVTYTQPPPGYNWFDNTDNVILFASVMAFAAVLTSACALCCWKFHRDGTCLPASCPTYKQCRRSAGRTCPCPIPCNFYEDKQKWKRKAKKKAAMAKETAAQPSATQKPKVVVSEEKEDKESSVSKDNKTKKKTDKDTRNGAVTPISIGNVSLHDTGMERARTPGFNAPTATAYGGKRSASPKLFKKR